MHSANVTSVFYKLLSTESSALNRVSILPLPESGSIIGKGNRKKGIDWRKWRGSSSL